MRRAGRVMSGAGPGGRWDGGRAVYLIRAGSEMPPRLARGSLMVVCVVLHLWAVCDGDMRHDVV